MTDGRPRRAAPFALALPLFLLPVRAATPAWGQDLSGARRDLVTADDFRLRVAATLLLGKERAPGTRADLERALDDRHAAVRVAAAAALGALGDPGAAPALERRLAVEMTPSVRTTAEKSLTLLRTTPTVRAMPGGTVALDPVEAPEEADWKRARFAVELGQVINGSGVRGDDVLPLLTATARANLAAVPGAILVDGGDRASQKRIKARHLPALGVDCRLTKLEIGRLEGQATVTARVELTLRRLPDHALRGTLSGTAAAVGSPEAVMKPRSLAQMQDRAIEGAIAISLRGAETMLARATK